MLITSIIIILAVKLSKRLNTPWSLWHINTELYRDETYHFIYSNVIVLRGAMTFHIV